MEFLQQNTKYKYLMSLGHFCTDINQGALAAALPFIIAAYGYSYAKASSLVMISNLVGSAVQPLIGCASDKHNTAWAFPTGMLMAGGGIALTGFTSSFLGLACAVVISGVGVSLFHPQAVKFVNYASEHHNKARSIGIFSFGGSLGFSLGPMIVAASIHAFGMRGTGAFILMELAACVIFFSQYGSLRELGAVRSRAGADGTPRREDEWAAFARLCVAIFGRSIMMCGMNTFLSLYWIHELGQSKAAGSAALSVYYAMGAACTLLGGRLADRFGCRRMIRISLSLFIPSILLMVFSRSLYLSGALLLPIVASLYFSYSPMVVLGQQYLPNHVGFASGVTLGLAVSVGGIMVPVLGMIGDNYGLSATFCTMAAFAVIPLTASFFLRPVQGTEDGEGETE